MAVLLLVLVIGTTKPPSLVRRHWRPPLLAGLTALVVLLLVAAGNAHFGPRFGIAPSPGWYLYTRVAQFADCRRFTPPIWYARTLPAYAARPAPQRVLLHV